jgi:V-type H+-transporting ATPase proteolipid subunit
LFKKVQFFNNSVPATGYKANAAYAHLASGLCCGFSSLVRYFFNI